MVDIKRTLQAKELREAVFSDPDLPETLRLFTLAGIHLWETAPDRQVVKEFRRESWAYRALRLMGRTGTVEELTPGLRSLIYDDVPKYRMDFTRTPPCLGTMLRPAGAPCKHRALSLRSTLVNPITGEGTQAGSCANLRHEQQADEILRAAQRAWEANGSPKPKPNSGGRLLRYFQGNMVELYAWADKAYSRGATVPEPPAENLAGVISLADHRNRKDT
ncbi:hypothetical protein [Microbacterium sp. NPDC089696]|uniref:hypothetical protein n=1 Tax=Microbacterium sp. NPDC089696 TaxID=3364199 RepID=UPI00380D117F